MLKYAKHEHVSLKDSSDFNEKWLQDRIVEEPAILGLGDLRVVERERRQSRAGRLDLLLHDDEENTRYEVELMLGATDESHIIRTIEYWDIERRRYPGYDHCAVLVAEDITSRFLNVVGLLSGTVPLIAIQLNALKVGDQIILDFVRVLDRTPLRRDDESEAVTSAPASREYWLGRTSPKVLELADALLTTINGNTAKHGKKYALNYNRYFVGLHDGAQSRNFVYFRPRKQFLRVVARLNEPAAWVARFEEAGVDSSVAEGALRFNVGPKELQGQRALIEEALAAAAEQYHD